MVTYSYDRTARRPRSPGGTAKQDAQKLERVKSLLGEIDVKGMWPTSGVDRAARDAVVDQLDGIDAALKKIRKGIPSY